MDQDALGQPRLTRAARQMDDVTAGSRALRRIERKRNRLLSPIESAIAADAWEAGVAYGRRQQRIEDALPGRP